MLTHTSSGDSYRSDPHARSPQLLALVHDAVIVRDLATGTACYWNRGAEVLYGWTADQVLHRDPLRLLRTESFPPPSEATATVARCGQWEGTLRQTTRGGDIRTVASRWVLHDDDRGRAILQADRDITAELREAEARATLAAARAAEVRRLGELAAMKADFTTMVAHELGGPVAAITRLADALAAAGGDLAAQTRMLAALQAEAAHLATLTADVRQAASAERDDFAVHARPVPLAPILVDAQTHAQTLPGDHPAHLADDTPPDTLVVADPGRVAQVLRNLLANAAKYSPDGAPIKLIAAPEGDRTVRLAVADCGRGIAPGDLRHILEKFGRGRDLAGQRAPGLGLGLYLSRRIVQAHGGDLDIASTPGHGSTFSFTLERAR